MRSRARQAGPAVGLHESFRTEGRLDWHVFSKGCKTEAQRQAALEGQQAKPGKGYTL